MVVFLILFLIADAIVLVASYFRYLPGAAAVCDITSPLCQYPVPLLVLGVIAAGLLMVQRN